MVTPELVAHPTMMVIVGFDIALHKCDHLLRLFDHTPQESWLHFKNKAQSRSLCWRLQVEEIVSKKLFYSFVCHLLPPLCLTKVETGML